MLEALAGIICNATEDKSQRVVLNDFSEIEKYIEPINEENEELLNIYSEAAILIEAKTGKILYDKDTDKSEKNLSKILDISSPPIHAIKATSAIGTLSKPSLTKDCTLPFSI